MNKQRLVCSLMVTLGLSLLGATAFAAETCERTGGHLVVADSVGPPVLDPHKDGSYQSSALVLPLVYEGLLNIDENNQVIPGLAESWENPTPTEYVFQLRSGVTFHNGREMTADDVKYSFERVLDPETGSPFRGLWLPVQQIEVEGPHTVRFVLDAPYAPFLRYLASYYGSFIVPREVVEEEGDLNRVAVGTGPFELTEYVPSSHLEFAANREYWREGIPCVDGLTLRIIEDESARLAAIRAGSVDITYVTAVSASVIERDPSLTLLQGNNAVYGMTLAQIVPNTAKAPFDDPLVREAISLAIDRQEIIDAVLFGTAEVSGPVPPGMSDWAVLPDYEVDRQRATELLAEAGYPDGFSATLKVSPQYPLDVAGAQIVQEHLRPIGIDISIEQVEWGIFLREWLDGNYDLVALTSGPLAEPDGFTFDYFYSESPRNRSQFFTGELNEILVEQRAELDVEQRQAILRTVQERILELNPVIYLYSADGFEVHAPRVNGYTQSRHTRYYFAEIWLDE